MEVDLCVIVMKVSGSFGLDWNFFSFFFFFWKSQHKSFFGYAGNFSGKTWARHGKVIENFISNFY